MPTFIKLTNYKNFVEKEKGFFEEKNKYEVKQEDFFKIPGSPIAYWVSDKVREIFKKNKKLGDIAEAKKGMFTGNNDLFLKYWFEISKYKFLVDFLPYNKGGKFRKWYGNQEYIINWQNNGERVKNYKGSGNIDEKIFFKKVITWSLIITDKTSFRIVDKNYFIMGDGGPIILSNNIYLLSVLNSKIIYSISQLLNPTVNLSSGVVSNFPIIFPKEESTKHKIDELTQECIDISKEEWDSRETSWDFTRNELLKHKSDGKIETAYTSYCNYWREKFNTLHANEEELNRLFIDIYELQDELTPDVALEDITILKNEAKIVEGELVFQADEIIKQFISYGVGVVFGRYSLDSDGLLIANMGQEVPSSTSFEIDDDNVIPVLEDDYFKDDIASRFVQFVKTTFGEENLRDNIRFIENALGTTIRKYFVKGFYEDHIKRYKKRPIYWMVASPKKGFMSLLYMHRYQSDVFARVRNSYLTEYIAKLEAHKETLHLTVISETASNKDKKDADKKIKSIEARLKELIAFDREKMMSISQNPVEIDLDDGVKVNYCKFKEILYPITGLCKK